MVAPGWLGHVSADVPAVHTVALLGVAPTHNIPDVVVGGAGTLIDVPATAFMYIDELVPASEPPYMLRVVVLAPVLAIDAPDA